MARECSSERVARLLCKRSLRLAVVARRARKRRRRRGCLSVCLSADRFVEQSIYFFGRCITIGVTAPLSLSLSLSLFIFVRRAARARVMYMVIYSGAAATRERVLIICRTLNRGKYSGERSRTASSSCAFPYILLCVGT